MPFSDLEGSNTFKKAGILRDYIKNLATKRIVFITLKSSIKGVNIKVTILRITLN